MSLVRCGNLAVTAMAVMRMGRDTVNGTTFITPETATVYDELPPTALEVEHVDAVARTAVSRTRNRAGERSAVRMDAETAFNGAGRVIATNTQVNEATGGWSDEQKDE